MAEILKVLKGTKDILPQDMEMWHFLEEKANEVFSQYGFKEIRTPIIEVTELFSRGVGDTTDIVNKEMYTFEKSERSITLRPENTAGVVRSYIENGMSRLSAPVKLWYHGPMFRYERPQAGRQRQFHQVGVEMFGIEQPTADAEVILMAVNYLKALGLNDLEVEINSLGCPKCREEFKNKLKAVLKPYFNELCEDCQKRYEKNPLRLLDCKVESCKEIFEKPEIKEVINSDFICEECSHHYTELKLYLDRMGVKYKENKIEDKFVEYTKQNTKTIETGDQDVINFVLKDKIQILPDDWNVQVSGFASRTSFTNKPKLIHYIGCDKPWVFASITFFKDLYFKNLQLTPWALTEEEKQKWIIENKKASRKKFWKKRPLCFLHPKYLYAFYCSYIKK